MPAYENWRSDSDIDSSSKSLAAHASMLLFEDYFRGQSFRPVYKSVEQTEAKHEPTESKKAQQHDDWTMLVQLQSGGPDSERKLEELKQLAEQSKGKSVTIIVQCAKSGSGAESESKQLERYAIRDGKITQLKSVESEGLTKDLKNLLQFGAANYPSDKLGAILHVHGGGNLGMFGKEGENPSVQEIADSIKAGLKESGHASLDVLNFDSCVMGQNGVLSKLQGLAKHVVASPQPEHYADTPKGSAQDIAGALKHLFDDAKMDGNSLANTFVEQARRQDDTPDAADPQNPNDRVVPIQTLTHFDLNAYPRFQDALNDLGTELIKAMNSEKNREQIKNIIHDTRSMDEANDASPGERVSLRGKRDLKDFTTNLLKAIDEGKLDADPKLRDSLLAVMSAQERLVKSYYGHKYNSDLGGLSVYLPEKATLDFDRISACWTPDGRLGRLSKTPPEQLSSDKQRDQLFRRISDEVSISKFTAEDGKASNGTTADAKTKEMITKIESQLKNLESALDKPEAFNKALQDLNVMAKSLSETEFFKALRNDARRDAQQNVKRELISGGDWQRFRERLISVLE